MSIKPDYLTLNNLLQGRLFRIPNYQRAYSWRTKQRTELFEDIQKLAKFADTERHHFMSTIVCLKQRKVEEFGSEEFGVFEVVDGQQRLTTLIILLKAIEKNLDDQKEAAKLGEILVKGDNRLILLQTNHDNSYIFHKYLVEGVAPETLSLKFIADKNMATAFKECEDFVANWKGGASNLLKIVKNRLDFIFYVLEEEAAVYTIFEVLNSRGLDVDWLDKCKSVLMGIAFEKLDKNSRDEHISELHKCWTNIYATIGLEKVPGQEILNFAATLKIPDAQSKIMSSEKSLEYFRKSCEADPTSTLKVSYLFLDIARKLEDLHQNPRLRAVTDIAQTRLLALAIKMNSSFSGDEKEVILANWERVTFRIYGLSRKDARWKVGEYIRLSRAVSNSKTMSKQDVIDEIEKIGADHPIERAVSDSWSIDCYNTWSANELLYFFFRYEEYLATQSGGSISTEIWEQIWRSTASDSIEHIHPQTTTADWNGKLSSDPEEFVQQVNRLGNLMLLPPGINSKASNKSFEDKKRVYQNNLQLKLVNEIVNQTTWDLNSIEQRENYLLEWAKETWR